MPLLFNRVAGDTVYSMTWVEVPVHLLDESLGAVRLRLRELPAGLLAELEDKIKEGSDPFALLMLVAWGVADHDPNDFLQATPEGQIPIPYRSTPGTYHGKEWLIAHPDTVDLYEHALPNGVFLQSIRAALAWYHVGVVPSPRLQWDSARPQKEPPVPLALAQTG
jgi:hypothetical protein